MDHWHCCRPFVAAGDFLGSEVMFASIVILFILGGMWEYNNIVFGKGFAIEKIEGLVFAVLLPLCVLFGNNQHLIALLALAVVLVFILFLGSIRESAFDFLSVAKVVFGIMYIPFLMSYFIAIRMLDQGVWWIVFVLILAFAGDTFALYAGKYFGKHKLVPLISPGKTVEGLIGLVLGSIVACLISAIMCCRKYPPCMWRLWLLSAALSDNWGISANPPLKEATV